MKKYLYMFCVVFAMSAAAVSKAEENGLQCLPCEGRLDSAIMRYEGNLAAYVQVKSHKNVELFAGWLNPNERFAVSGALNYRDKKRTLGAKIRFYIDGTRSSELHTSCSVEIGPGTVTGEFIVIAATSRINGLTCPVADIPDNEEEPCQDEECGEGPGEGGPIND